MPIILVKFGDVFRFHEQEFVFLAQTDELTYAAKILDQKFTSQVVSLYERRDARNVQNLNNVLYSFVILNTLGFKGRMAHFKNTDQVGQPQGFEVINTLNPADLQEIKSEIMSSKSAVPMKLKELIRDIKV